MQEITQLPEWFDGKKVNEILFCQEFLAEHPMVCVKGTFFTVDKRIADERELKKLIYDKLICRCRPTVSMWQTERCFWMVRSPRTKNTVGTG